MRAAVWLTPALAVTGTLLMGGVGFFAMLVALNGVSEARATPLLVAYLLLLLVNLVFTVWASRQIRQRLGARTRWPHWVQASAALLATLLVAWAALLIGSLILLLVGVA